MKTRFFPRLSKEGVKGWFRIKARFVLLIATAVCVIFILSLNLFSQEGNKIVVDKISVPVVTITDPQLIDFFMFEFFVAETLVTRLDIIDATGNGFGEDDLVKTYPSEAIYFPVPSDSAQKIMNSWQFKANFQIVTEHRQPEEFENAPNGIFAGILRGVNRNYSDQPMKILFERDDKGVTFEMWGYNPGALNYAPPPPAVPDSVVTYDLVRVFRADTLMKADTKLYDLIYVYKSVSDTVYFENGAKVE